MAGTGPEGLAELGAERAPRRESRGQAGVATGTGKPLTLKLPGAR